MKEKVILAYSGGLDTSVSIKWLTDQGYDVVACCLDIGEGRDTQSIKDKALDVGAIESYAIDAREEFAQDFALIALQGNTFYENSYPLVSALSRPLIAKKLVELAIATGATTVAHGCTGKGNDQVRFEKKRLPMPLKKGCRFLPIWITLIRSIKIFGAGLANAGS